MIDEGVAVGVGGDGDEVLQVAQSDAGGGLDHAGEVFRAGGGAGRDGDDEDQAAARLQQRGAGGQQPRQPDPVGGGVLVQGPAGDHETGRLLQGVVGWRVGRRVGRWVQLRVGEIVTEPGAHLG